MNLPVGKLASQGVKTSEYNLNKEFEKLTEGMFSGYVVATIEGFAGIEEGVLIFRKGNAVGSIYEYNKYGITVYGNSAIPQFFNSLSAKYGIIDVISLSTQQSELVLAFHDKVKLGKELSKKDIEKNYKKGFTTKYAEQVLSEVLKEKKSKYDVFKKLGLVGLE